MPPPLKAQSHHNNLFNQQTTNNHHHHQQQHQHQNNNNNNNNSGNENGTGDSDSGMEVVEEPTLRPSDLIRGNHNRSMSIISGESIKNIDMCE